MPSAFQNASTIRRPCVDHQRQRTARNSNNTRIDARPTFHLAAAPRVLHPPIESIDTVNIDQQFDASREWAGAGFGDH